MTRSSTTALLGLFFAAGSLQAATPPNDNFNNAQVLTSGVKVSGDLDDSTREPGDPDDNNGGRGTVWYRWTAPASGVVRVSVRSSMSYNNLQAMIGSSAVSGLYLTADGTSSIFYAVGGQTYNLVFFAYQNLVNPNDFDLTLSADASLPADTKLVPPYSNDDFSEGYVVTGSSADLVVPTLYATQEPFEQDMRNAINGLSSSFRASSAGGTWLNWTAPASGKVTVTSKIVVANKQTLLVAGTGSSLAEIQLLAAGYSGMQFVCQAGVTYHLYLLNPYSDMALVQLSLAGANGGGGNVTGVAAQAGVFAGAVGTTGNIKVTLAKSGTFTGSARLAGVNYSWKGSLDANGNFLGAAGKGATATTVSLHADLSVTKADPGEYELTGSIAGTSFAASHASYLAGQTAVEAGPYTVLLPATSAAADVPQGTGTGKLTVSKTGSVTATGKLAEGTSWSVSGPLVGASGHHAFVWSSALLYKAKGTFAGTLTFANLAASDASGAITWIKPAAAGQYFTGGFSTTLSAVAARYLPPAHGAMAIGFPAVAENARVTLTSGGLSSTLAIGGTLTSANAVLLDTPNDQKIGVKLAAAGGTWSGSFVHPLTGKPVKWSGVLFQKTGAPKARGFFLGPVTDGVGLSGDATLAPAP